MATVYKIHLKDKFTGKEEILFNEIFNERNGVARFQIDKNWEILSVKQRVFTKNDTDYYEGDKVCVIGTKKIGKYETEIVRDLQGWTLKENKTYFNNDKCFTAIIEKI